MNSLKLKQLRSESNYTQSKVARLLYISQSTYAAYETGKVDPSIDILKKIAVLFNVI